MIFDGHCHAWPRWPMEAGVPDSSQRGSVESLLYEMDAHDVDRAAVVCARMGRELGPESANEDNNDYVADAVARHPDRLIMLADIDGVWCPEEHHVSGASRRLRQAADRYGLVAFTHYVGMEADGWFVSDEGMEFFGTASELGLVVSLGMPPAWQSELRTVAQAFPTLPLVVHHQGFARMSTDTFASDLAGVIANSDLPNVFVKVSGYHYLSHTGWEYPYPDVQEAVFQPMLGAYGHERLIWGSDFAAARSSVTYRQSIEVLRTHGGLDEANLSAVMGGNLERLLANPRLDLS